MINASIPLGVQNLQLPNPLEMQRAIREQQTARRQGTMSDLLLAGAQRDEAKAMEADKKARTMQGLLQVNTEMGPNGLTVNKQRLMGDLTRLGMPQEAMDVQKQTAAEEKVARDNKRLEFKTKLDIMGQVLGGHTKENYGVKHGILKSLGFDDDDIPPPDRYDPGAVENALKQGLTYKERLEMEDKQNNAKSKTASDAENRALELRRIQETERNNRAQNSIARQNANTSAISATAKAAENAPGKVNIPGLAPIPGVEITKDSVKKVKDGAVAFDELKKQIAGLREMYSGKLDPKTGKRSGGTGTEFAGENARRLQSKLRQIQLTLKGPEFLQLGVLAGPDMELLNEMIGDPTSLANNVKSMIPGMGDPVAPQMAELESFLEGKFASALERNGFQRVQGAAAPVPAVSGLKANPDGSFDYIPGGR